MWGSLSVSSVVRLLQILSQLNLERPDGLYRMLLGSNRTEIQRNMVLPGLIGWKSCVNSQKSQENDKAPEMKVVLAL